MDNGPFVVIHLQDLQGTVKAQGGAAAGLAAKVLPKTVGAEVYKKIRDEIVFGLKSKGIDADVSVVDTSPKGGPPSREFLIGAGLGAVAMLGVGWLSDLIFRKK